MSESGPSFAAQLLAQETSKVGESLRATDADPSQTTVLTERINAFVLSAEPNLPLTTPQKTVTHEGSTGFLSPSARREVGRAWFRGQEPPPVRVIEEDVPAGEPERTLDALTLHVVHGVDATMLGSSQKQELFAQAVASLGEVLLNGSGSTVDGSAPDGPKIRIAEMGGVVHLIKRDSGGHYVVEEHALNKPADIDNVLKAYTDALTWTTRDHPEESQGSHALEPTVIGQRLSDRVSEGVDATHKNVVIGIDSMGALMPQGTKFIRVSDSGTTLSQFEKTEYSNRIEPRYIDSL